MDYGNDFQKLHQSVPVTTQPTTPEQIRYFSKHATERNVFKWTTTALQTTHGFLAFAAWTAIYSWVFQNILWLLWLAPFLAGFSLLAMHIIFRATWETFWYDKLDDDPNTDSPIYVPIAVIILLLIAEVNGVQRFLTAQVKAPETRDAAPVISDHSTTLASIEQSYKNDRSAIEATYKEKERAATLPYDRQLRTARNRAADTPEERRQRARDVAAIERQRDAALAPVLAAKSNALERALNTYSDAKNNAEGRRQQGVATVDAHNAAENSRYTTQLGEVGTYSWVISIGLLALIMMLSYRVVRINVNSGIIAQRNYTVLDAHGNPFDVICTALADAFKRQWLRFGVAVHRALSPKKALTSFDGTVIAQPGTYNTFAPPPAPLPTTSNDEEAMLRQKVAEKIMREAAEKKVVISPELLEKELQAARLSNGHYKDTPLGKPEPSPAPQARPAEGHPVAPHPTAAAADEPRWTAFFKNDMLSQIEAYDRAVREGNSRQAAEHQNYINDPTAPLYKLGKRLGLSWGIEAGQILVWRDRSPHTKVPLEHLSPEALDGATLSAEAPAAGEDENLFKYDLNKFKQEIQVERDPDSGEVVGVKYKKMNQKWANIGYSQVKSAQNIYRGYCEKPNASPRVKEQFAKWTWVLSLFEQGREVEEENLRTVTV